MGGFVMCDPVQTIATIQVELEAKEPQWIAQLETEIAQLGEEITEREHKRYVARKALTLLRIRQGKDEADQ